MSAEDPLTYNQVVAGICELIEVSIHSVLYIREVYPAELFVRRKKYDTPVYQSRHPGLNEYISGAIKAVFNELLQNNVEKVIIVIKNKEDVPLERFIFAVQHMIEVEESQRNLSVENATAYTPLTQLFRSFLLKLNMVESQLERLPSEKDNSFAIVIESPEGKAPSGPSEDEGPPPWAPAIPEHTTSSVSDKSELHLLRAIETGIINIAMGVQESEEKFELLKDSPPQPGVKPSTSTTTGSMGPPPLPPQPPEPPVQDKGKGKGKAPLSVEQAGEGPIQLGETGKDSERVLNEEMKDKEPQAGDKRRRVSFARDDEEKDLTASNAELVDVEK